MSARVAATTARPALPPPGGSHMSPLTPGPASAVIDSATDSRPRALPVIKGTVGPGFDISINQSSVPAGRHRLVVRDRSTIHNFHFFGPGVDRRTGVRGTGR